MLTRCEINMLEAGRSASVKLKPAADVSAGGATDFVRKSSCVIVSFPRIQYIRI